MTLHTRIKLVLRQSGRILAGLAIAAPLIGHSQTGLAPAAPSPDAAASTAPSPASPLRPAPRVTSPSDARRSLDLNNPQPEGKVTPQLRIPLGKKGDTPIFQRQRPADSTPTSNGNSINDGAARCEAMVGTQVRAKCRDQLAHESPR